MIQYDARELYLLELEVVQNPSSTYILSFFFFYVDDGE
jgi:hypothetical protein